jgi:uncharacterized membrane protein
MVHNIAHRLAHPAENGHHGALTRIQAVVIFGSISSGLLACALGAFIYDIVAVVAGR